MDRKQADAEDVESWARWKHANAAKLIHPAGFEEKFVDLVISQIPGISPQDVIPQFSFKDERGKNRRIDFVILNNEKGYLLPIELDGASKDDVRAKWTDFLERQNALIGSFGTVLRYSNAKMFNNPGAIVREISEHLAVQAAARIASDQRQAVLLDFLKSAERPLPVVPQCLPGQEAVPGRWRISTILIGVLCAAVLSALAYVHLFGSGPDGSRASNSEPGRPEGYIAPDQAAAFVGEIQSVCGTVAGTSRLSSGHQFINFERPYPNHVMSAVIWHNNQPAVGPLAVADGSTFCVRGLIEEYNGKPRINIISRDQIPR